MTGSSITLLPRALSPKDLNTSTDLIVCTEIHGGAEMATITVSVGDELERVRKKFPDVDWNEVLKRGLLKRLEELKKFEELRKRGEL
jgi:hypothetical protein